MIHFNHTKNAFTNSQPTSYTATTPTQTPPTTTTITTTMFQQRSVSLINISTVMVCT